MNAKKTKAMNRFYGFAEARAMRRAMRRKTKRSMPFPWAELKRAAHQLMKERQAHRLDSPF